MIAKILSEMKDLKDYVAIVPLLRSESPLTREEADRLLAVYARYLPEITDQDEWRLYIAVDLMPGRGRENAEDFTALELGKKNMDALFTAKELMEDAGGRLADSVVEKLADEDILLPVKMILARIALDCMANRQDFALVRDQLKTIAEFLISCGDEKFEQYGGLIAEAQRRFQS